MTKIIQGGLFLVSAPLTFRIFYLNQYFLNIAMNIEMKDKVPPHRMTSKRKRNENFSLKYLIVKNISLSSQLLSDKAHTGLDGG